MSFIRVETKINEIEKIESGKFKKVLTHLSKLKNRTRNLLNYVQQLPTDEQKEYSYLLNTPDNVLNRKIYNCHTNLVFHHYPEIDKYKLVEAYHCDQHLLCPICAIRRASKKLKVYEQKTKAILLKYEKLGIPLYIYHIVPTVKNGENLKERYNHITGVIKKILRRRRESFVKDKNKSNYVQDSMFSGSIGGVYSIEIKKGKNKQMWHPHGHLLLITTKILDYQAIYTEYAYLTGDSTNIGITKVESDNLEKQFYELFKYALKFSDMDFGDNLTAYESMKGRRLVGSFGEYRGLQAGKDLEDDLDSIYDFIALQYKFDMFKKQYKYISKEDKKHSKLTLKRVDVLS